MSAPTVTRCIDRRCDRGILPCDDCNGWGKTSPKGGKYKRRCREIPSWAVDHAACHGTGMVACGCTPLDDAEVALIEGRLTAYLATRELDELEAAWQQETRSVQHA